MERSEIERLRDNSPKTVKVPGFSIEAIRSAVERAYKKCCVMNGCDKWFREEINKYWWVSLKINGAIPIISFSLERWLEEPDLKHLKVFSQELYMCEVNIDSDDSALRAMLNNINVVRKKKGHPVYAVTGGFVLKGY